jgi:hypothetical protein
MILMQAPGPNLTFGSTPSGTTYISDASGLIKITNNSTADQTALQNAGCFTLTPFGGYGNFGFTLLSDLYAADAATLFTGVTGYPSHTVATIFNDGGNTGTWYKTGTGAGSGNWTQASTSTALSAATAAAASAAAAAASVGSVAPLVGHNPNLAISVVQGQYVNKTNGGLNTLAGYETFSGPCVAGTTIRVNRTTPGNSAGLAFFTAGNTYIATGSGDATAFTDIVIPATATNFKISLLNPGFYDQTGNADPQFTFQVWDTAQGTPADYQAPGYVDPYQASKRANAIVRAHRPAWDYYDAETITKDAVVNVAGGITLTAGFGLDLLPMISCEYGTPIYFSHALNLGSPSYGIAWYDHAGNFIAGTGASVTANLSGTTMTVTAQGGSFGRLAIGGPVSGTGIPAGCYIVSGPADGGLGAYTLSASATTGSSINVQQLGYLANVGVYPPKGAGQFRTMINSANRALLRISNAPFTSTSDLRGLIGFADAKGRYPLRNRVGALLGSSIMYCVKTGDQRMTYQLERLTRSYFAISRPVPGWGISQILGDTVAAGYSALRGPTGTMVSGDWSGIDWCLSDGAINNTGTTIGTLGDTTTATFYGIMYDTYIAKLATWNPSMRIILMTPLPYFNGGGVSGDFANGNPTYANGSKLSDYADAVKLFAQRYKFPVIDQYYGGIGINAINKAIMLDASDLLHPVAVGYDRIIPWIASELNRIGGFL